jgi:DNA-binding NarL/FixJ family response regulator
MSGLAKILIIDDNPKLMADALPMYGYEVECAVDGLVGIKMLNGEKSDYDLILLDIKMPNMDGWETLKFIRASKKHKTIPIILLTSIDSDAKIISGLKCGADDYITKPCILPNLLARIEALLRRTNWEMEKKKTDVLPFVSDKPIVELTQREQEILSYVAKGASNAQIAQKLFVKDTTIKTHLNNIYKKLNVESRVQATLLAMQMNLL